MMDVIVGNVLQGLTSLAHEEFKLLWNAKHDVERMKNTSVQSKLHYRKQWKRPTKITIKLALWFVRLKDVLYDAMNGF
ncbi:hypothetical protein K1719_012637 [Acacia pycnantha]|nr:hypothetical protein K1719_012637 [Acacia pycnantha]